MVMSLLLTYSEARRGSIGLALSIAASALIYFVVLFVLKGFTVEEIDFVKKMLHNIESPRTTDPIINGDR